MNDIPLTSIVENLRTRFVGQNVLYHPVTSSTMDVAKQAAREGAAEGTIVIADQQTAGRGRLGRKWLSPPESSILLSIVLYPKLEELPRLNMAACLAVARSIEKGTGLKPSIKWPNDVLIDGKKVSGVLMESDVQGDIVRYAIVGLAVNVNLDPSSIPEIAETATSLKEALGHEVSRLEMLTSLLTEFEELYSAIRRSERIEEEWRRHLETLGKEVTVRCGQDIWEGYAESVDEDGNLLLRLRDGSLITVAAGDVTLRA